MEFPNYHARIYHRHVVFFLTSRTLDKIIIVNKNISSHSYAFCITIAAERFKSTLKFSTFSVSSFMLPSTVYLGK